MTWAGKTAVKSAAVAPRSAPACCRLLAALWLVAATHADVVTLTNGNTVEGLIVQESARVLVIDTSAGRISIPRERVQSVSRGEPWDVYIQRGQQAVEQRQWASALDSYRAAQDLMTQSPGQVSADVSAEVTQAIADCETQLQTQSLQIYADVLKQVDALEQAGRYQDALDLINSTLQQSPEGAPTRVLRQRAARVLVTQAKHQRDLVESLRAVASLRQAIEMDSDNAEAHLMLGGMLADRNPADPEAVRELQRAIDLFPSDTPDDVVLQARYQLAQCLEATAHYQEAADAYSYVYQHAGRQYSRALSKAVDNLLALAAATPATEENYLRLLDILNRAHQMDPSRIQPLNQLGDLNFQLGRIPEALTAYRQSLDIVHSQADVHLKVGEIQLSLGDLNGALQSFSFAVQFDPNNYAAHCHLAEIYETRGQFNAALSEAQTAIAINNRLSWGYIISGRVHRKQENLDAARADFQRAIEVNPNALEPRLEMGRILAQEQRYDEAMTNFQDVLRMIDTGDIVSDLTPAKIRAQCLVGVGQIHMLRNEMHQAEDNFNDACDLDPTYADAFSALGKVYMETQRYRDAEAAFKRAIELKPEEPNNYYSLGILYHNHLHDRDRAIENYRLYLSHNGTDIDEVNQALNELQASPAP